MSIVNEILNFNFSTSQCEHSAKSIISDSLRASVERRIKILNEISNRIDSDHSIPPQQTIKDIFCKFKRILSEDKTIFDQFERKELKLISYVLDYSDGKLPTIFSVTEELDLVFKLLENNWRDSNLIGMMNCLLKNWNSRYNDSKEKLGKFISNKLMQYQGKRRILGIFKKHSKFYNTQNGDFILGKEFALKKYQINLITDFLYLPESWFQYQYFTNVIISYYENKDSKLIKTLEDIEKTLIMHNLKITNYKIIPNLIILANMTTNIEFKEILKNMALKLIGDPEIPSYWSDFENATVKDKTNLKQARIILNEWITQQFINVFFEKCINDIRRQRFWLKYVKYITKFRIVGSNYIKDKLLNDKRIKEYVNNRFINTSSIYSKNSALMFEIKDHLFIEFSDEGAFYVYKPSNPNIPNIDSKYINNTSYLKSSSMKYIIYRKKDEIIEINDEGRLGHKDGMSSWEEIAELWIKLKVGVYV